MAKELKLDKAKILKQLKSLKRFSSEWSLEYDPDVDQLFYGLKRIPKGYFLFQVNDEISLFVNKHSRVGGMFIEYFGNNFLEHNIDLKPVLRVLEDKDRSSAESQKFKRAALEQDLILDAYTTLAEKDELVTAVS